MTNKDYEFRDSIKQAIKEALNETTLKIQVIADKPSGKWIDDKVDDFSQSFGFEKFHCSICKTIIKGSLAEKSNFCPNCGAKMEQGETE